RAHLRDPRSARHLARGRRHPAEARAPGRRAGARELKARDPDRVGDAAGRLAPGPRAADRGSDRRRVNQGTLRTGVHSLDAKKSRAGTVPAPPMVTVERGSPAASTGTLAS